jgi:hypothetical protein
MLHYIAVVMVPAVEEILDEKVTHIIRYSTSTVGV